MKIKIYLGIVLLIIISCEKEPLPEALPPLTMSGENTFGCLINNEVFVPGIHRFSGPDGISNEIIFSSFPLYPQYFLSISVHRLADFNDEIKDISLFIQVDSLKSAEKFEYSRFSLIYRNESYSKIIDSEINIVNLDTINKIISGTFFTAIANDFDTVFITEGRFDLKQQ